MAAKIRCITKACRKTDEIFDQIVDHTPEFKTEIDIDRFIRKLVRKHNLKIAFPPIVATGKNAAQPHHKPKNTRLKGFTVLDFGVKVGGYCSDMSRTIFFGNPTKSQIKIYNLLLKVQDSAIKEARIGNTYFGLDKYARERLGRYKRYFIHSLGHGIGKKVHCVPIIASVFKKKMTRKREELIKKIKEAKIRQDDIVTIEPGIYIKNKLGIRIEDTIIVKKTPTPLTRSTKRLLIF